MELNTESGVNLNSAIRILGSIGFSVETQNEHLYCFDRNTMQSVIPKYVISAFGSKNRLKEVFGIGEYA
jgi:hypothetical protein